MYLLDATIAAVNSIPEIHPIVSEVLVTRAGLTMLQMFQLKWAYPQSMNFRGLP